MGDTLKMKLYNVYRICKKHINFFEIIKITEKEELNASETKRIRIFTINNWLELKEVLNIINKIPALTNYANDYIESVPDSLRDNIAPRMEIDRYNNFISKKNTLYNKMKNIIELYESMNLENDGSGLDIKLPHCESLKEYISYLKDLEFVFSQCPYLRNDKESLKFASVDVGSNWIKLTIAGASTCLLLTNVASLVDKAIILRSHYITLEQQEEMLKSQQIKNELAKENIKTFEALRSTYTNIIIDQLEKESNETWNPEERDITKVSLEKLIYLLDKGTEIYATLDSPEDTQALFPEIQGNLELPDNIMKYLESKSEEQQE